MDKLVFDMQRFATPSPKNLLLGAGPLYFDRYDANGKSTGLRHLGNVEKFTFKTDVQKVSKQSSMSAARRTYAEAAKEVTATGSLTMDEFDPANLALGLFGEEGIIRQEAATVTDKVYIAKLGTAIQLPGYKVTDLVVKPESDTVAMIGDAKAFAVTLSDGTVTSGGSYTGTSHDTYYVVITAGNTTAGDIAGCKFKYRKGLTGTYSAEVTATGLVQPLAEGVTVMLTLTGSQNFVANDIYQIQVTAAGAAYIPDADYKVNAVEARGGLVVFPETSSIPDGSTVRISYTLPAGSFPKVSGATVGNIQGMLLFMGDSSYGPCYNGEFWHVSLIPNGDIGMIGEDFATFSIDFTCMDDSEHHPDDPLYRLVKLG
ncbi:MAG TPA: hypothetical protein PKA10_18340 [Selenomonadales bacterium]|nr:hypothetical protein [Selenomonadales bacterium]